ncbi:MAG: PepSY-like domain-containing protein [Methyloglobulus sp.]|nr:hypothetical protein [Methyloglobulus sp.]
MKRQHIIIVVFGILFAISAQANVKEKALSRNQVPKAVIEAFEKAYPNAKELDFEEEPFEGKTAYEVEYKTNGIGYEFLYSADGVLLQKQEVIVDKALPPLVAQAIKKAHPNADIMEAEQVMNPDGAVTGYEVKVNVDGKVFELDLDVSGKTSKSEND